MRGMTENLTIGERVAWYRRRRGLSQDVLAGLNGRTTDWLSKAENNRIELDRLSVIRRLAETLDVSLGDLVGEPTLLDWSADSGTSTVPALRAALMDYRQLTPILSAPSADTEPPDLSELARELGAVCDAYQASRFGFAAGRAPLLLADAIHAARQYDGDAGLRASELLALSYQAAASVLTKLGESDLAWIAAERGLAAAQQTNSYAVTGSLFRSVAFSLLATGRMEPAMQLAEAGARYLEPYLNGGDGDITSAYGMPLSLARWPPHAARTAHRHGPTSTRPSAQLNCSARTGTTCGLPLVRRTSRSTVSIRLWSSVTYRSRSTWGPA